MVILVSKPVVTQQNAALVEQAAAAAESLEEQAKNLVVTVSNFKVGDDADGFYPLITHSTAPAPRHGTALVTVDAGSWEAF